MTEMTPITLNLQAPNVNVIVHAKEGDRAGRYMNASLVDGATAFIPPQNAYFAVRYMKADGNGGLYDTMEDNVTPAVTLSGNIATIGIAEQALTVPGRVAMELNIYDHTGKRISTFTFTMIVEETVMPDGNVESTEYFNILTHEIALALQASDVVQAVVDMTVEGEKLPAGSTPTVEKDYDPEAGTLKLTFGLVTGDDGKSAYQSAVDGGYAGTEAQFNVELAGLNEAATAAQAAAAAAAQSKEDVEALAETIAGNVGIDDDYTGEDTTWSSNKINEELNKFGKENINLFNTDRITPERYLNQGSLVYNPNYFTSDYIDVSEYDSLTASYTLWGAFYNENKEYIDGVECQSEVNDVTFEITENAHYLRFCANNTNLDKCQVGVNVSRSKYFNFEDYILNNLKIKLEQIINFAPDEKKVIYVGSGHTFTSVSAALNSITDASEHNRYILFVLNGNYEETFRTKNYVDIVGENKYKTIINYTNPNPTQGISVNQSTIFAESTCMLKNLTITTTGTKYPVHSDASVGAYDLVIEDCIIQHNGAYDAESGAILFGTAMGIGLYGNQNITLRRCVLNGVPRTAGYGASALYCHNTRGESGSLIAHRQLNIECCEFNNSTYGFTLQAIEDNNLQDNDCYMVNVINNGIQKEKFEYNTKDSWHVHKFNVV